MYALIYIFIIAILFTYSCFYIYMFVIYQTLCNPRNDSLSFTKRMKKNKKFVKKCILINGYYIKLSHLSITSNKLIYYIY